MEGFKALEHQAAGHPGILVDTSQGNLFAKLTTQQEIDFYSAIYAKELEHQRRELLSGKDGEEAEHRYVGSLLSDWMPQFIGRLDSGITKELEEKGVVNSEELEKAKQQLVKNENLTVPEDKPYVVLENVLYGFEKPSIIDIKLGKVLTDENVTPEKKERLAKVSKTTTSGSLGFRICGMKTYQKNEQIHKYKGILANEKDGPFYLLNTDEASITYNKHFGRNLTAKNVIDGFKLFFSENSLATEQQKAVIEKTIQRLQLLYNCLLDTEVRMFSVSILIVFENDAERWKKVSDYDDDPLVREDFGISDDEEDEEEKSFDELCPNAPMSSLNLIDFAHSKLTPGKGPDGNILDGMESLLEIFEKIRESY